MKIFYLERFNNFDIRFYISQQTLDIECFDKVAENARKELMAAMGVTAYMGKGLGKTYICSNEKGIYFTWLYTAPNNECTVSIANLLVKNGWKQVKII